MKRIINSLIFALFSLPILAQDADKVADRWYEVEIIFFEQLNPASTGAEQWPLDVEQPDLSNAIDLLHSPAETQATSAIAQAGTDNTKDPYLDTAYLLLPKQQYQLTDTYKKLADSENYLPLLHLAWRQIIPPRDQPDRIFIHDSLNATAEQQSLAQVSTIEFESGLASPASAGLSTEVITQQSITANAAPGQTLSGIISLGLGRYIHVDVDLLLHKPQIENSVEDEPAPPIYMDPEKVRFDTLVSEPPVEKEQTPELFRIQGSLRMPSKEVHYLDHPLVGMLILFTPYEVPVPEVIEKDNNDLGLVITI